MSERADNFSSGPAVLPEPVLRRAQQAIWRYGSAGAGILELSHRGAEFTEIIARATATARRLAQIPDSYEILFLHGGASSQFFMAPMNLLDDDATADYLVTGTWSLKAASEAERFGQVHVAGSSEATRFDRVPDEHQWSASPSYVHLTSNETIHGVEWHALPTPPTGAPLVCDASSDIFSRPIDIGRYGMIYAGAQKNLGPSGTTVVIGRRELLSKSVRDLPTMLRYKTHLDEHSLYNTPTTFAVYVIAEVLEWLEQQGGIAGIAAQNQVKAKTLYDFIDGSKLFRGHAQPGSRSTMNVVFGTGADGLDNACVNAAERAGLLGLRGHRSVGGLRASLYNALPLAAVVRLVEFLARFEKDHR